MPGHIWIGMAFVGACLCFAQPSQTTVRLATVMVPASSRLLDDLLPEFERQSGYQVQRYLTNQDIYDVARTGAADLVISHYGLPGAEPFVLQALGRWPRRIFASQHGVLGPPPD